MTFDPIVLGEEVKKAFGSYLFGSNPQAFHNLLQRFDPSGKRFEEKLGDFIRKRQKDHTYVLSLNL